MSHSVPRDVPEALTKLGVHIARMSEDEVYAKCPMHERRVGKPDRSPSWSVNRDHGWHMCFSCGYGGTFVELVMDLAGLDVFYAHRWIRKNGVRIIDSEDLPHYYDTVEREERKPDIEVSDADLALFYLPPQGPRERRGISQEACEFYDILWDIETLSWITPIRRPEGKLIGWQSKNERDFDNFPRNVAKGECVFGLEQLEEGEPAILEESPLDCARVRTAGITGAISSYGAEVTDTQMRLILSKTDVITFALDNDRPGRQSTQKLLMGVEKRGRVTHRGWATRFRETYVVNYGDLHAKDHGEMTDDEIIWSIENRHTVAELALGRFKDRSKDDDRSNTGRARGRGTRTGRAGSARRTGAAEPGSSRDRVRDRARQPRGRDHRGRRR